MQLMEERVKEMFDARMDWDEEPVERTIRPQHWFAAERVQLCEWLHRQLTRPPSVDTEEQPDSPRPLQRISPHPAAHAAVDDAIPTPAAAPAAGVRPTDACS